MSKSFRKWFQRIWSNRNAGGTCGCCSWWSFHSCIHGASLQVIGSLSCCDVWSVVSEMRGILLRSLSLGGRVIMVRYMASIICLVMPNASIFARQIRSQ